MFWVVRPEISYGGISGLNTVLSGPYIDCTPGTGPAQEQFTGLAQPPAALGPGVHILLDAPRLEQIQANSPVYYRGIQVGTVQSINLNPNADAVLLHLFIQHPFEPLVRTDSKFWVVNGIDIKGGIFSGVQMKLDSLRALISGGVTFNSPDNPGAPAADGAAFSLFDEPKKDWLNWAPKIPIPFQQNSADEQTNAPTGQQAPSNAVTGK